MTCELARQLKDANFPISHDDGDQCYVLGCYMFDIDNTIHTPTLSELIKACGFDFNSLNHAPKGEGLKWFAIGKWDDDEFPTIGDTPEEAVSKLWLELNKHE